MMPGTVIFDFDGTLADTRADVWSSVEYAAELMGGTVPGSFREKASNVALPEEEIFRAACPGVSVDRLGEFTDAIARHYRTINLFPQTELYSGIEPMLNELVGMGTQCRIITQKPHEALIRLLNVKNWTGYFKGTLSPDSFGGDPLKKSELIGRLIGDGDRLDYIYVGDSFTDITAARENGIRSIGVLYGDGDAQLLTAQQPDYICESPGCLRGTLLNL